MNELALDGMIVHCEAVRHTPAGLQVFEGVLHHSGQVREAGGVRSLDFECDVMAFGAVAERLQEMELPAKVALKGYIAPRSMRSRRLIVYITDFN